MDSSKKKELQKLACKVRMGVIEGVFHAKSGHPGGSLSVADMLTYLYECEMRIDPKNPSWEDRDRFVLSKGHTAPALYSILALKGYFSQDELQHLRHTGALLQGHPDMKTIPGVDMSSGSLGQGISAAAGMALSAKMHHRDYRVYTVLGDGEIEEGQVWEAAMFASAKKLDNLVAVVDNNNLQIGGTLEEENSPYPIDEKFKAFGWEVAVIDGHDFEQIEAALSQARQCKERPFVIVMKTMKGKDVSYMENSCGWHGKAPNEEQYLVAKRELEELLKKLEEN